ncbi:MAG TPA: twitching motility protein PilT [Actinomycetota bacterium]|nr:twitching motility protein PilT [Actinomycetota bacterium]
MNLVLDAGALVALERNERPMWRRLWEARQRGDGLATHGGIVGQVWRGGQRPSRLAALLLTLEVHPLDATLGRSAGELLRATGLADVIDAALVALCADGDWIVTSDADDLAPLVRAAGRDIVLVRP